MATPTPLVPESSATHPAPSSEAAGGSIATASAIESARLPEGVVVQPRRFEFRDLDAVPQYWFGGNAIITHMENAFSLLIPPGERFFVRSVRAYEHCAKDPELAELVRGFAQQEGLHMRAHNEFNASFARFGVDVDREVAYAERAIARMERWLPRKMRLGATVFLEHLTAVGAHMLFTRPELAEMMHPEALRFWRWHGAEELEHKAVAFDLFKEAGGGYLLRVLSAIAAVAFLLPSMQRMIVRMVKEDPNRVTPEMRQQARDLNKKLAGPQLRMLGRYFKPSFHPWDEGDGQYLRAWYGEAQPAA